MTGDLTVHHVDTLRTQLEPCTQTTHVQLELDGLDIDDAVAVTELLNLIRETLSKAASLTLFRAPQILAHDLYRAHLLRPESALKLIEPRQELPYG